MAIFDELRSEYKTAREVGHDYYHRCDLFARSLAGRLQKYIDAPAHFTDMNDEQISYIETVGVRQQQDGSYKSIENAGYMELINSDENGYWLTGLRFILDVAPKAFPKGRFLKPC